MATLTKYTEISVAPHTLATNAAVHEDIPDLHMPTTGLLRSTPRSHNTEERTVVVITLQ